MQTTVKELIERLNTLPEDETIVWLVVRPEDVVVYVEEAEDTENLDNEQFTKALEKSWKWVMRTVDEARESIAETIADHHV